MSLMDALAIEPFSVNEPLIDSLLLEPDTMEVYLVNSGSGSGSGTIASPWVVTTADAFDDKISSYSESNITFHLGPGNFLTKGFASTTPWKPKTGWRFIGAGMDVTTLKLDGGGYVCG